MGRLVVLNGADGQTARQPTVYTRTSTENAWVAIPYLYCTQATKSLGLSIGTATLVWEFGTIQQNASSSFATVSKLDLLRRHVKIEWTPNSGTGNYDFVTNDRLSLEGVFVGQRVLEGSTIWEFDGPLNEEDNPANWTNTGLVPADDLETWHGIITDQNIERLGTVSAPAGTQVFTCHSLEWLLTRRQIETSVVKTEDGSPITTITINDGLTFNPISERMDDRNGNKSGDTDTNGDHVFAQNAEDAEQWDASQILEYLLARHSPYDTGSWTWELKSGAADRIEWLKPIDVKTYGRTVFDVINEVCSRQRGLVWWLTVDEDNSKVELNVDTVLDTDATLPVSSDTVPANADPITLSYDNDAIIGQSFAVTSTQKQYDQVVVEGARRGTVATLRLPISDADGLSEGWDSSARNSYATAFSGDGSYSGLSAAEKAEANDNMRKSNPVLRDVYSLFRLDSTWAGTVKDDEIAHLQLESDTAEDVSPAASKDVWVDGIRFERQLPIFEDLDYLTPDSPTPIGAGPYEPMRPLVGIDPDPDGSSKLVAIDNLGSLADSEKLGAGAVTNIRVAIEENQPAFRLVSSKPNHVIAKGTFDPSTAAATTELPQLDHDTIFATMYMRFPERVRVEDPETPGTWHNTESRLVIRLGERARLDYMPEGTIYRIKDNYEPVESTSAGYVRDDRQLMRDVARMAYSWYIFPRRSIDVEIRELTSSIPIGSLVTTVHGDGVFSVVSSVTWDFTTNQTKVATEFGELDFTRLI